MVSHLRNCPGIISSYARSSERHGRRILCTSKNHLSNDASSKTGVLSQKLDEIIKWYDEFTGMDEVRKAQSRVLEEERIFRKAQEIRRNYLVELNEIQTKIKELYAELDTVSRGDDKYIALVTMEHKLLKEEKAIMDKFTLAEKDERESFANLSNSVKLSHEKERAQGERTKYWSIIGSVIGTILGILGTSINNHFKMKELKELIKSSSDKTMVTNLRSLLDSNESFLNELKKYFDLKTCDQVSSNTEVKLESLLNAINSKLDNLDEKFKSREMRKEVFDDSSSSRKNTRDSSKSPTDDKLLPENKNIKMFLYAFAVFSSLTLILSRYTG
ncbi:hypothetical protein RUM44_004693 [Polyplax serrata]|uniref:Coiled-coil domain-containing protein 51 n=1 Tax=Polyplax serrata TaxID=468196 RepID=A0ABR1B3M0_POLSC